MNSQDNRNLIIALALSVAVFWGWSYFYEKPQQKQQAAQSAVESKSASQAPAVAVEPVLANRDVAVTQGPRLSIDSPTVKGSINLQGGRLDDIVLKDYLQTTEPNSGHVAVLSPEKSKDGYYTEFGWVSSDKGLTLPDASTPWTAQGNKELKPDAPVTLTYETKDLSFTRELTMDKDYLITVKDQVTSKMDKAVRLNPYALVLRESVPKTQDFFILHEGPIGYLADKLVEIKYTDFEKKPVQTFASKGGWLGITDKYWLVALIPDQTMDVSVNYREIKKVKGSKIQVDFTGPEMSLEPAKTISFTQHVFAGPKVLHLLDGYETKLGVKHFDLAVDFGWFYFLTKPIFYLLTSAKDFLGNLGLGILLLTVVLKVLFFPLANKSFRSMARMKALQPKIEALRERFKDDKLRVNQEIMELYKREKVNPMAGCLPTVVQIPVFFALYKVLFVTIEMRHAPFYGWIHDLSAPDPTNLFTLFGLIPWSPPSMFMIGGWPLIMGATMILQQRLSPTPADPTQEKMMLMMPVFFTYLLASFPAGLVIYWAWNNILTMLQQLTIMRMESKRK